MSFRVAKNCKESTLCRRSSRCCTQNMNWGPSYSTPWVRLCSQLGRNPGRGPDSAKIRHAPTSLHDRLEAPRLSRGYASASASGDPSKSPYPYPSNSSPTAHQIFHLPGGATQAQIKARYYELVRCHHPDSHHSRLLPPNVAHARFQSIVAAYDYLRGKTASHIPGAKAYGFQGDKSHFDPYLHELARRRRAQRAAESAFKESPEEDNFNQNGVKERSLFVFGVVVLILGLYPSFVLVPFQIEKTHKAAVVNLSEARREAREVGEERRSEIRKRVQDMQRSANEPGCDDNSQTVKPIRRSPSSNSQEE